MEEELNAILCMPIGGTRAITPGSTIGTCHTCGGPLWAAVVEQVAEVLCNAT